VAPSLYHADFCNKIGHNRPLALQETSVRTFAYFHTRPAAPAPSLFLAKSNGCNLSESCHRAVSRVLYFNGSVGAVGERALWDRLFRSWPPFEFHKRVRRFAAGGPF
jgi:hypothetical protein